MALSDRPQDNATAHRRARTVSRGLFVGVLLLPAVFVWFLLRRGYSTRSQVIGIAWLGVLGLALLLSAPHGFVTGAKPKSDAPGKPRSWETPIAVSNENGGPSALEFKLAPTRPVHRMLRTSITLTNNVGRDLQYVEVFCSYYDGGGTLLGYGMSNWAAVKAGDTLSGEVVASGVNIDDVKRRECRARHL